jgi:dTDP-4-amino-4,6-dideoxygalactose transaminase
MVGDRPESASIRRDVQQYKGTCFALAVNSCTAALHLSMLAIGLRPGDEIIIPAVTFASTANAVIHAGGKPVLADCNQQTMNIEPDNIMKKI